MSVLLPEIRRWHRGLSAAQFGVWDLDVLREQVHYPAAWKRRMGYPRPDAADDTEFWRCRVHPDDLAAMLHALRAHVDGSAGTYEMVFRLRSNGSGYRTVRSRGRAVARDAAGLATRMVGTMVDLTGRPVSPGGWGLVMDDGRPYPSSPHPPLHAVLGLGQGWDFGAGRDGAANSGAPDEAGEALVGRVDDLLELAWRESLGSA